MARWILYGFAASFVWGTTPIAVKLIGGEVHPFALAFYRNVFALPVFLAFLYATGRGPAVRKSFNKNHLYRMIALGGIGVSVFTAVVFTGITLTLANRASLFINANPILIAALSVVFLREKLNLRKAAGISLGFLGILLAFTLQNPNEINYSTESLIGDVLSFLGGFSWAVFTIMGKRWQHGLDPYATTFAFSIFGTVLLAVLTAPLGLLLTEFSFRSISLTLYLAVFPVFVGYSVWLAALKLADASSVGVVQFSIPVFAAILSVIILAEPVSLSLFAGLALTGVGIFLALRA